MNCINMFVGQCFRIIKCITLGLLLVLCTQVFATEYQIVRYDMNGTDLESQKSVVLSYVAKLVDENIEVVLHYKKNQNGFGEKVYINPAEIDETCLGRTILTTNERSKIDTNWNTVLGCFNMADTNHNKYDVNNNSRTVADNSLQGIKTTSDENSICTDCINCISCANFAKCVKGLCCAGVICIVINAFGTLGDYVAGEDRGFFPWN